MNKQDIIDKLKELGIDSSNAYPKSSFVLNGNVYVGLYEREMKEDFYFYNTFDKKIYRYNAGGTGHAKDIKTEKFLVFLSECETIWADVPYVELPDMEYDRMTLRHYSCIHLRVPNSGLPWLDELIKKAI